MYLKSIIIISIIIIVIIVTIFYKKYDNYTEIKKSTYLKDMRSKIFPIRLFDIKLNDDITTEENYLKIFKICPKVPTNEEMIFLLKYKKFVDLPNVYSMADNNEIDQIHDLLVDIIKNKIEGCLVETGVWRGGMGCWMKSILREYEPSSNRKIYLFDTFKYFPKPDDTNNKDKNIHSVVELLFENMQPVDQVRDNFKKFDLIDSNVHFVEGLFSETIPKTNVGQIAILRLDSDYYESTMFVLENYYKNIVRGGYLIIDDYNNPFLGCKDAVTDFRKKHNITNKIIDYHGGSVYWQIL